MASTLGVRAISSGYRYLRSEIIVPRPAMAWKRDVKEQERPASIGKHLEVV
jgi:hypothetical protein